MHEPVSPREDPAAPDRLADARAALARHFGYPDFRGVQPAAIRAVLAGRDVLALMPTGGGKSLCYQVPALVLPGLAIVVSPLISLMKDQVDALLRRGIRATFVNSTLGPHEAERRLDACARGDYRLLYIAPERLDVGDFRRWLRARPISLLAIDESHCISEWGHDFRPSYLRLGAVRQELGCPCIALTATATHAVREDILHHLRLRRPVVVAGGFDRPNLAWHVVGVRDDAERDRRLLRLLRQPHGGVAVVYAPTRRRVDSIADMFHHAGIRASGYHAGASARDRSRLQDLFMQGDTPVIVATSAFGMGIDKPDVRIVIHHAMPATLESYYQEAGRAGRDGRSAHCVLLHAFRDRFTHEFLIDQRQPPEAVVRAVLAALPRPRADGTITTRLARLVADARVPGGPQQAEAALRTLERTGLLTVEIPGRGEAASGSLVLRTEVAGPGRALDGRAIRRAREREYARLDWMQRYAFSKGCRRAFLLRYFGEDPARTCPACDRCLAQPLPGAADARPPRPPLTLRLWRAIRRTP